MSKYTPTNEELDAAATLIGAHAYASNQAVKGEMEEYDIHFHAHLNLEQRLSQVALEMKELGVVFNPKADNKCFVALAPAQNRALKKMLSDNGISFSK